MKYWGIVVACESGERPEAIVEFGRSSFENLGNGAECSRVDGVMK